MEEPYNHTINFTDLNQSSQQLIPSDAQQSHSQAEGMSRNHTHQQNPQGREIDKEAAKIHEKPADGAFDVYDPFARPPNFEIAEKHALARRIGYVSEADKANKENPLCPCCGSHIKNEPLNLCCSKSELSIIGPGFPLYFEFIQYLIILTLLLLCCIGIPGMVKNYNDESCTNFLNWHPEVEFHCDTSSQIKLSLGNRSLDQTNQYPLSGILNLIFALLGCISIVIYRRISNRTAEEIDRGNTTPSDFTIMATNFPKDATIEEIKNYFRSNSLPNCELDVKKVVPCYYIGDYVEMNQAKAKIETKIWSAQQKDDKDSITALEKEKKAIDEKIENFEKECADGFSSKFTDADDVAERWKMSGLRRIWMQLKSNMSSDVAYCYKGKLINVIRAPEPTDILWENLGYPSCEVFRKRMATTFASLLSLGLSFGIIIGIQYVQKAIRDEEKTIGNENILKIIGLGASIVITLINSMLGIIYRKFSSYEKYPTYTQYNIAVTKKIALVTLMKLFLFVNLGIVKAQFFNTALLTLVVNILVQPGMDYRSYKVRPIWTNGGLVNNMFWIFVINAISPNLMAILNPSDFLRCMKRRNAIRKGKNCNLNQQQANLLFEGPPIDMSVKYTNILKTVFLAAFYANMLPVGIAIAVGALLFAYWTDKILLLRRHARPVALGSELSEEMSDVMEFVILAFAAGNLIFDKLLYDSTNVFNVAALVVGGLFWILPKGIWKKCTEAEQHQENQSNYDIIKLTFMSDYDRANPITQSDANKAFFEEILAKEVANESNHEKKKTLEAFYHDLLNAQHKGNESNDHRTKFQNLGFYAQANMGVSQMPNNLAFGPSTQHQPVPNQMNMFGPRMTTPMMNPMMNSIFARGPNYGPGGMMPTMYRPGFGQPPAPFIGNFMSTPQPIRQQNNGLPLPTHQHSNQLINISGPNPNANPFQRNIQLTTPQPIQNQPPLQPFQQNPNSQMVQRPPQNLQQPPLNLQQAPPMNLQPQFPPQNLQQPQPQIIQQPPHAFSQPPQIFNQPQPLPGSVITHQLPPQQFPTNLYPSNQVAVQINGHPHFHRQQHRHF